MQDLLIEAFNNAIKSPPVDLDELCKNIDVELVKKPLDEDISGLLDKNEDGTYKITVNSNMTLGRQRFTVAHELGHLAMHRHLIGEGLDDRAYRSDRPSHYDNKNITKAHETEANRFAVSLLMPKDAVYKAALKYGQDNIAELAKHFKVSKQAMEIRLNTLLKE